MFEYVFGIIKDFLKQLFTARLFPLYMVFAVMFLLLIGRLFKLQIIDAESYQKTYIEKIEGTITLPATRGNIYDSKGNLLAYNELTYSVTFQDVDEYKNNQQKNDAILKMVRLMDKYDETIISTIPISVNEEGKLEFSATNEAARKRFIKDVYGTAKISSMLKEGVDVYELPVEDVFDKLRTLYYFHKWKDEDGNIRELDYETQLKVLAVRYSLASIAYRKYMSVTICENVKDSTVAAVMENSSKIYGMSVQENSVRVYNNAPYFAHIIGYTGKASDSDLEALKETDESYVIGDVVGKSGVESLMELQLHGVKGTQEIYKDSVGRIIEVISTEPAQVGNDVYLTIDSDMQMGCYHLLEQMIAGIILKYLVPYDYENDGTEENPPIPIKDVYFALINNNVLAIDEFANDSAGDTEKEMYRIFSKRLDDVSQYIASELNSSEPKSFQLLDPVYQDYMSFIYSDMLIKELKILDTSRIPSDDETLLKWKDGEISLREFLYYAISMNWVDTSKLLTDENSSLYSSTEEIYSLVVNTISEEMKNASSFHKKIYGELIYDGEITGNQLCVALIDQGMIKATDEEERTRLLNGDTTDAYNFMVSKIKSLEITPAQLALDPCSGAVVVTNAKTGEALAVVSYPSFDNNRLSGTIDAQYWDTLTNDLSTPLLCRATQTTIAPGSTYKMISSIAGLEEGVILPDSSVDCTGVYEKVSPNPTCWIGEPGHGVISVVGALAQSCNCFFYDIGYSLSTIDGSFDEEKGLKLLEKYATLFGLNTTSGIEMSERTPTISYEEPVASAIGQGKNSYSTVQLSRYVTALASGNLYNLSLLDQVKDSQGNVVENYTPELVNTIVLNDETWNNVRAGMFAVTHYGGGYVGTVSNHFSNCVVDVAGKTGSAQHDKSRSEHAQFVSYAPYDDPEITVTVTIPNGYSSGYCAYLACGIYNYIYGDEALEDIMKQPAYPLGGNVESGD